jgi:hypothetical protein
MAGGFIFKDPGFLVQAVGAEQQHARIAIDLVGAGRKKLLLKELCGSLCATAESWSIMVSKST